MLPTIPTASSSGHCSPGRSTPAPARPTRSPPWRRCERGWPRTSGWTRHPWFARRSARSSPRTRRLRARPTAVTRGVQLDRGVARRAAAVRLRSQAVFTSRPDGHNDEVTQKSAWFESPADAEKQLAAVGYLSDTATSTTTYLAGALEKPLLSRDPRASGRPSWPRRSPARRAPSWCGCSATRGSTRRGRSTSGTTRSSCSASRPRATSPGTRPTTTSSPTSSC